MSDSNRMPLDGLQKRDRLVRFDNKLDAGDLIQIALFLGACLAGYGAYSADQAKRDMKVEQVRVDLESEKQLRQQAIAQFDANLQRLTQAVNDTNVNVAILRERSDREAHK